MVEKISAEGLQDLLDGDSHHETNGEVPSPVPPHERDLNNESFFEYGSRVGVWRLLNLLERYEVPSTFFCCALALERNPEVATETPTADELARSGAGGGRRGASRYLCCGAGVFPRRLAGSRWPPMGTHARPLG